jgi:ribosomal protein S18 acetylase RimI-like enzyme
METFAAWLLLRQLRANVRTSDVTRMCWQTLADGSMEPVDPHPVGENSFQRLLRVRKEHGLRGLWFRVLGGRCYRRVWLWERSLHEPIPEVPTGVTTEINRLADDQIDEYQTLRPDAAADVVRRQLAAGYECFVARHEIIAALWATTANYHSEYIDRQIRLASGDVYFFDLFTAIDFRGQAIAQAMTATRLRHYRDAGLRRATILISPENRPSRRTFRKLGFRPVAVLGYSKLGPWRHDFTRPLT